jgi:hypothetical protein
MLNQIKTTMSSREFQTGVGQVAIAVTSIVVSSVVSGLVNKGLNAGLEKLMDKVHGVAEVVVTPTEE